MAVTVDTGGLRHTAALCQQIARNVETDSQQLGSAEMELQGSVQGMAMQLDGQLQSIRTQLARLAQRLAETSDYLNKTAGQYEQADNHLSAYQAGGMSRGGTANSPQAGGGGTASLPPRMSHP